MYGSVAPGSRPQTNHRPERSVAVAGERYAEIVTLPVRTPISARSGANGRRGSFELQLLGGFRLTSNGELVDVGRIGQRLLAVLAFRGRQATRSQIAHALWPDTVTERAHANLRTALYRLGRRAPGAVHATTSYLQLSVGMQIDYELTTRLASRILSGDAAGDPELLTDL